MASSISRELLLTVTRGCTATALGAHSEDRAGLDVERPELSPAAGGGNANWSGQLVCKRLAQLCSPSDV